MPDSFAGAPAIADFARQHVHAFHVLKQALLAADSGVDRMLQVGVYVDDIANWPAFDTLCREWNRAPRAARAAGPPGPQHFGFQVEREAVAFA